MASFQFLFMGRQTHLWRRHRTHLPMGMGMGTQCRIVVYTVALLSPKATHNSSPPTRENESLECGPKHHNYKQNLHEPLKGAITLLYSNPVAAVYARESLGRLVAARSSDVRKSVTERSLSLLLTAWKTLVAGNSTAAAGRTTARPSVRHSSVSIRLQEAYKQRSGSAQIKTLAHLFNPRDNWWNIRCQHMLSVHRGTKRACGLYSRLPAPYVCLLQSFPR